MSIYGSGLRLGEDRFGDDPPPPETWPRTYQLSHIYPSTEHPDAWVDTASIPHWCIPGHDGEGPGYECTACDEQHVDGYAAGIAPWMRLSIGGNEGHYTVVVPAAGVKELRDYLTEWLDRVVKQP